MSWLGEHYSSFTEKLSALTKDVLNENQEHALADSIEHQNEILPQEKLLRLCEEKDAQLRMLLEEKELLERSIDELDQQHQEAIDELLILKNQAVKENNELKVKLAAAEIKGRTDARLKNHFDCTLYNSNPEIKLTDGTDDLYEKLNLLLIFKTFQRYNTELEIQEQLQWLENQKANVLESSLSEKDSNSKDNLSNKINYYISFLETLSENKNSLTSAINEVADVLNFLVSENGAMKRNENSCEPLQNESSRSVTSEVKSVQVDIRKETDDSSIQTIFLNPLTSDFSSQTVSSVLDISCQTNVKEFNDSVISKDCQTDSFSLKGEDNSSKDSLIAELEVSIQILEQDKADLIEKLCSYDSIQENLISVTTQTDNDYSCRCVAMEAEIASMKQILEEKEKDYSDAIKNATKNISELNHKLEAKDVLVKNKEAAIKSLETEVSIAKNKINSLTHDLSYHKKNNDYAKDIDTAENNKKIVTQTCNKCAHSNSGFNQNNSISSNELILLNEKLKLLDLEKSKLLCVLNEKTQECSTLKSEVHKLTNIVASEKQALLKLQQDNCELRQSKADADPELTKEAVQKLSRLIRDKDFEIESLKQKNSTLTTLIQDASSVPEHLQSLMEEKENLSKQINVFKADRDKVMVSYNNLDKECRQYASEIKKLKLALSNQKEKFDVLEHEHSSVSQQYEEKQKSLINTQNELIALKQRVTDLEQQQVDIKEKYSELLNKMNSETFIQITKDELSAKDNRIEQLTHANDEKDHLIEEKDCIIHDLSQQIKKLKSEYDNLEHTFAGLQKKLSDLNNKLAEYESTIEKLQSDKESFDLRFQDKNSETSLLKEMNERLNMALKEKEFAMQSMTEKVSSLSRYINSDASKSGTVDINQILADSESMFSKAQNLYRERDETLLALNQSRQENQSLRNEIQRMKSSEIHLKNELERLRMHLLEIEENYTHEALKAGEREKELRDELLEVKRRAEISNTAIVDTNQRASIQIASLQEQLSMIANQRDQALAQVSSLEDKVQQHSAAVSKLQLVLEQKQRGHERKIKEVEKKYLMQLETQKELTKEIENKLRSKQMQLEESSEALEAATRLSEQLDAKEEIIANLKSELAKVENKVKSTAKEIDCIKSNTEGKVDRMVMKSLVLGYFSTPANQKSEVIRLLARVLDFNQEEMEKAGLAVGRSPSRVEPKQGLFSSIFNRLPTITSTEQSPHSSQKSFTTLFVQFLENESQPIVPMPFPAEQMAQQLSLKANPNKKHSSSEKMSPKKSSPLLLDIDSAFPTFTPVPAIEYSQSPSLLREVLEKS
ncbi:thyroid receptor-interacting protein 11-like [Uloborus diversus]|uniref:thyroid receptor-interacting protein 11-like n=1 Tax=Uloborus diversus TaxID=327109 RepID=UPI00240971A7|nr:thyroid receptor-interacting protein 11-like [Uloborus diversus]